ncbi:hypothetical protein BURMUCGD1_4364 [Burkholderia multivorans CGD1]|nr:hypothetical protein BURMUCGD1_4364 [Burkholderia multivorans CGD1]
MFLHIALRQAHDVMHRAMRPRDRSCRCTRALATFARLCNVVGAGRYLHRKSRSIRRWRRRRVAIRRV